MFFSVHMIKRKQVILELVLSSNHFKRLSYGVIFIKKWNMHC